MDAELYLFVDRDGTEWISDICPSNVLTYIKNRFVSKPQNNDGNFARYSLEYFLDMWEKRLCDDWYTYLRDSDYGKFAGDDMELDATELPKGFIKFLIDRDLTYEDGVFAYNYKDYIKEQK